MSKTDHSYNPAPCPPLIRDYGPEPVRRARVDALFDATAQHYDWINRIMSWGTGTAYRTRALRATGLQPGMALLDVGAGTGVIALKAQALVGPAGQVVALDPSRGMLRMAQQCGVQQAVRGLGERLPFRDHCFDVLSMGYALRHVSDLHRLFCEYRRVLKPQGQLVLMEITAPQSRLTYRVLELYLKHLIPRLARLKSAQASALMAYYWDTIVDCVAPPVILDALCNAGFVAVKRQVELQVFSAYRAYSP